MNMCVSTIEEQSGNEPSNVYFSKNYINKKKKEKEAWGMKEKYQIKLKPEVLWDKNNISWMNVCASSYVCMCLHVSRCRWLTNEGLEFFFCFCVLRERERARVIFLHSARTHNFTFTTLWCVLIEKCNMCVRKEYRELYLYMKIGCWNKKSRRSSKSDAREYI